MMSEIVIYQTNDKETQIEIQFEQDTFWLTQQQIADLFGTQRPAITKHIGNIFKSGELEEKVVSSILEHTTQHGAIEGKTQESKVNTTDQLKRQDFSPLSKNVTVCHSERSEEPTSSTKLILNT